MEDTLATITLRYPVPFGDETVSELTLRRPRGSDVRAMGRGKSDEEKTLILIGRLAGLPDKVVDDLDMGDIARLDAVLGPYLEKKPSPPTGTS